jgi:hypothetical protein
MNTTLRVIRNFTDHLDVMATLREPCRERMHACLGRTDLGWEVLAENYYAHDISDVNWHRDVGASAV